MTPDTTSIGKTRLTPGARRRLVLALVPAAACIVGALLPLPVALQGGDRVLTRVLAAVGAAVVSGAAAAWLFGATPARRRALGLAIAGLALVMGLVVALDAARRQRLCTATYRQQPQLIGTELTPTAAAYLADNPGLDADGLLFDAAGEAAAVWTSPSIARCRLALIATHGWWWPCLVVALLGVARALTAGPSLTPARPGRSGSRDVRPKAPAVLRYDAFISYRHGGQDGPSARALAAALEDEGYTVAIDVRDFAPNAHFLLEMERCIRESRFTVALLSARYLYSGPCEEEALITRVLDFGDRQRRLIPLYLEPVDAPAWLHGLVGIAFHGRDPIVDPLERLVAAMGPPLAREASPAANDGGADR